MANTCSNEITVLGLTEPTEAFVKKLSISMFNIDLDAMESYKWARDGSDGKTCYQMLIEEHRVERATHYCVLFPSEPYKHCGVTVPRFYVDTKWVPVLNEIVKTSESYPELTFHLSWSLMSETRVGEYVVRNGKVVEAIKRQVSWSSFDSLYCPLGTLLAAHLPFTLPQRAALRVEDAIDIFKDLRSILDDPCLLESSFAPLRDPSKIALTKKTLDDTFAYLSKVAKRLTFEGVFIDDLK